MFVFEIMSTIIAVFAFIISIFSYFHFCKQTRSDALLACLEQYLQIARLREEAISEKSEQLAKLYYQEMFDLLWTEFHLWHYKLIPRPVMRAWLHSRFLNYHQDTIEFTTREGEVIKICYKDIWENLKEKEYLHSTDTFVPFMDLLHEGKLDDALKLKVERTMKYRLFDKLS